MKIFSAILLLALVNLPGSYSQTTTVKGVQPSFDHKIEVGEEYTYLVKYAFLNLGEVRTKIFAKEKFKGRTVYKAIAYIDSYEGLPLVDLHQTFESWFDSYLHPVFFQSFLFGDTDTTFTKYIFEEENQVRVVKGKLSDSEASLDTTIKVRGTFYDGLTVLYAARYNFGTLDSITLPCFIAEDTSTTFVNYYHETEEISLDAVGYNIGSLRLDGEATFAGVFGLTGYFEGWFSDDEHRVPLSANLQVMIGNVTLELIDWKNKKWQPPVYKN